LLSGEEEQTTISPVAVDKPGTAVQEHDQGPQQDQELEVQDHEREQDQEPEVFLEYQVEYDDADVLPAGDQAVSDFAMLSVTLLNNTAGAYGDARIGFHPLNAIPSSGVIYLEFPESFLSVSAARLRNGIEGIDGTVRVSVASKRVKLERNGDGSDVQAGKYVSFTLSGIMNPGQSGDAGNFTILTLGSDGDEIDQGRADEVVIAPGLLEGAEVILDNGSSGDMTEVEISFVVRNAVPPTGSITIQFPVDVTIRDVSMALQGACEGIDGSFRVNVTRTKVGSVVSVVRQGDGSLIQPRSEVSVVLNVRISPQTALGTGNYRIQTTAGDGSVIDENSKVAGLAVQDESEAPDSSSELLRNLQSAVQLRLGGTPDILLDLMNHRIELLTVLEFATSDQLQVQSKHSHILLQIAHAMDITQDVMDEFDLGLAQWRIEIHVHANSNSKVNWRLSNDRAQALKTVLAEKYEVEPASLHAKGHGSAQPQRKGDQECFVEILFSLDGRFGDLPGNTPAPASKETSIRPPSTTVKDNQEDDQAV